MLFIHKCQIYKGIRLNFELNPIQIIGYNLKDYNSYKISEYLKKLWKIPF